MGLLKIWLFFFFFAAPTLLSFYTQKLWGFIWTGVGIPHFQGIPPHFYLPFINVNSSPPLSPVFAKLWICASLCLPDSCSPTCLDRCGFFQSSAVRLHTAQFFRQFWVLFLWDLVVINSLCGWTKRQSVYTCACILTRSLFLSLFLNITIQAF